MFDVTVVPSNGRSWLRTTGFDRVRHDLLQIRVPGEEIGETARARGTGARQLRRGWCAVGIGIAGIGGQTGQELVAHTAGRVKPAVGVIAGQCAAKLVAEIDPCEVVAACHIGR